MVVCDRGPATFDQELLEDGLQLSLVGMGVAFAILTALALSIKLFERVETMIPDSSSSSSPAAPAAPPPEESKPAPIPVKSEPVVEDVSEAAPADDAEEASAESDAARAISAPMV